MVGTGRGVRSLTVWLLLVLAVAQIVAASGNGNHVTVVSSGGTLIARVENDSGSYDSLPLTGLSQQAFSTISIQLDDHFPANEAADYQVGEEEAHRREADLLPVWSKDAHFPRMAFNVSRLESFAITSTDSHDSVHVHHVPEGVTASFLIDAGTGDDAVIIDHDVAGPLTVNSGGFLHIRAVMNGDCDMIATGTNLLAGGCICSGNSFLSFQASNMVTVSGLLFTDRGALSIIGNGAQGAAVGVLIDLNGAVRTNSGRITIAGTGAQAGVDVNGGEITTGGIPDSITGTGGQFGVQFRNSATLDVGTAVSITGSASPIDFPFAAGVQFFGSSIFSSGTVALSVTGSIDGMNSVAVSSTCHGVSFDTTLIAASTMDLQLDGTATSCFYDGSRGVSMFDMVSVSVADFDITGDVFGASLPASIGISIDNTNIVAVGLARLIGTASGQGFSAGVAGFTTTLTVNGMLIVSGGVQATSGSDNVNVYFQDSLVSSSGSTQLTGNASAFDTTGVFVLRSTVSAFTLTINADGDPDINAKGGLYFEDTDTTVTSLLSISSQAIGNAPSYAMTFLGGSLDVGALSASAIAGQQAGGVLLANMDISLGTSSNSIFSDTNLSSELAVTINNVDFIAVGGPLSVTGTTVGSEVVLIDGMSWSPSLPQSFFVNAGCINCGAVPAIIMTGPIDSTGVIDLDGVQDNPSGGAGVVFNGTYTGAAGSILALTGLSTNEEETDFLMCPGVHVGPTSIIDLATGGELIIDGEGCMGVLFEGSIVAEDAIITLNGTATDNVPRPAATGLSFLPSMAIDSPMAVYDLMGTGGEVGLVFNGQLIGADIFLNGTGADGVNLAGSVSVGGRSTGLDVQGEGAVLGVRCNADLISRDSFSIVLLEGTSGVGTLNAGVWLAAGTIDSQGPVMISGTSLSGSGTGVLIGPMHSGFVEATASAPPVTIIGIADLEDELGAKTGVSIDSTWTLGNRQLSLLGAVRSGPLPVGMVGGATGVEIASSAAISAAEVTINGDVADAMCTSMACVGVGLYGSAESTAGSATITGTGGGGAMTSIGVRISSAASLAGGPVVCEGTATASLTANYGISIEADLDVPDGSRFTGLSGCGGSGILFESVLITMDSDARFEGTGGSSCGASGQPGIYVASSDFALSSGQAFFSGTGEGSGVGGDGIVLDVVGLFGPGSYSISGVKSTVGSGAGVRIPFGWTSDTLVDIDGEGGPGIFMSGLFVNEPSQTSVVMGNNPDSGFAIELSGVSFEMQGGFFLHGGQASQIIYLDDFSTTGNGPGPMHFYNPVSSAEIELLAPNAIVTFELGLQTLAATITGSVVTLNDTLIVDDFISFAADEVFLDAPSTFLGTGGLLVDSGVLTFGPGAGNPTDLLSIELGPLATLEFPPGFDFTLTASEARLSGTIGNNFPPETVQITSPLVALSGTDINSESSVTIASDRINFTFDTTIVSATGHVSLGSPNLSKLSPAFVGLSIDSPVTVILDFALGLNVDQLTLRTPSVTLLNDVNGDILLLDTECFCSGRVAGTIEAAGTSSIIMGISDDTVCALMVNGLILRDSSSLLLTVNEQSPTCDVDYYLANEVQILDDATLSFSIVNNLARGVETVVIESDLIIGSFDDLPADLGGIPCSFTYKRNPSPSATRTPSGTPTPSVVSSPSATPSPSVTPTSLPVSLKANGASRPARRVDMAGVPPFGLVVQLNQLPVAVDDSYTFFSTDGTLSVAASPDGLLSNDSDPDLTTLSAVVVASVPPSDGFLTVLSDGSFTYNPVGFTGTTTFSYRAFDGVEFSNVATGTITVLVPTPSRTPEPSASASRSRTAAPSASATPTASTSMSRTASISFTPFFSESSSVTVTQTPSKTPLVSNQQVGPSIAGPSPSIVPSVSPSPQVEPSPTSSPIPSPSNLPEAAGSDVPQVFPAGTGPVTVAGTGGEPVATVDTPEDLPGTLVVTMPIDDIFMADDVDSDILDVRFFGEDGREITQFEEPIEICFMQQTSKDTCLGFFNSNGKWECEDNCLKPSNNEICGQTKHLTNFALLLDNTDSNGDPCDNSSFDYTFTWLSLAAVACCCCFVLFAVIIIEAKIRLKQHKRDSEFSRISRQQTSASA